MNPETAGKSLSSDDTEVVVAAIRILGTSGSISDLQALMGRMKHSSPEVRKAAVHSAGRLIHDKLMADYGTLEPAIRDKPALLLESLDPKVVGEIGKDVYSDDAHRRLTQVSQPSDVPSGCRGERAVCVRCCARLPYEKRRGIR